MQRRPFVSRLGHRAFLPSSLSLVVVELQSVPDYKEGDTQRSVFYPVGDSELWWISFRGVSASQLIRKESALRQNPLEERSQVK